MIRHTRAKAYLQTYFNAEIVECTSDYITAIITRHKYGDIHDMQWCKDRGIEMVSCHTASNDSVLGVFKIDRGVDDG